MPFSDRDALPTAAPGTVRLTRPAAAGVFGRGDR